LAALVAPPAAAQLNGHNLRGDYGLSAGSQPPPGIWVGLLYPNIDIDTLRDRDGNEIPSDFDIDYHAIAPWLWWVSKTKVLGGNYSIFVAPVWGNSALEAPVLGIDSTAGPTIWPGWESMFPLGATTPTAMTTWVWGCGPTKPLAEPRST
jgi:hypothetical protein